MHDDRPLHPIAETLMVTALGFLVGLKKRLLDKVVGRQVNVFDNVLCADGVTRQVSCLTRDAFTERTTTFRVFGLDARLNGHDHRFCERTQRWVQITCDRC